MEQENEALLDWQEYHKAWVELSKVAKQLLEFAAYLSTEQKRSLDALNKELDTLKKTF